MKLLRNTSWKNWSAVFRSYLASFGINMFYLEVIVDLQAVVKNNPEDPMDLPPSVPQAYLISLGDNTTIRTLMLT